MITTDKYIKKLENKSIFVRPLEDYKGSSTKILHKCECGNEWEIRPNSVLSGVKCKCSKTKQKDTNKQYLIRLKNKKIKILPVEIYIGVYTPIEHKCVCGKIFIKEPHSILKGTTCGCKAKNKRIYSVKTYKNRRTILYYVKVDNLYKIGLSIWENDLGAKENILRKRFGKKIYEKYNITILDYEVFDDGAKAFYLEKEILNTYKKYKYLSEDMKSFPGYTELFITDIFKSQRSK